MGNIDNGELKWRRIRRSERYAYESESTKMLGRGWTPITSGWLCSATVEDRAAVACAMLRCHSWKRANAAMSAKTCIEQSGTYKTGGAVIRGTDLIVSFGVVRIILRAFGSAERRSSIR